LREVASTRRESRHSGSLVGMFVFEMLLAEMLYHWVF
jgi:hypothetical protein